MAETGFDETWEKTSSGAMKLVDSAVSTRSEEELTSLRLDELVQQPIDNLSTREKDELLSMLAKKVLGVI